MTCGIATRFRHRDRRHESSRRPPVEAFTDKIAIVVAQCLGRLTPCRSLSIR